MFSFMLYLVAYLVVLAGFAFLVVSTVILAVTEPYSQVVHYPTESEYWDPREHRSHKFHSISESPSLYLSIVVPAYNEEERLPPMLDEALEYLESKKGTDANYTYEIIVVSDGSIDGTVKVAHTYSEKYGVDKVKCLELVKNRGKGGAVRLGVERARGAIILFADADGATKFEDLSKLEKSLEECAGVKPSDRRVGGDSTAIVIGSRAHLEKESLASRSIFRTILMYGFHFLVWLFTVRNIRDTQCGFKLFTRRAARICFQSLHVDRWAFDVELLYIAQRLNIPICEISVRWTEIEGSKVTPVWSWIQMGCDLCLIWFKYKLGAWKLGTNKVD